MPFYEIIKNDRDSRNELCSYRPRGFAASFLEDCPSTPNLKLIQELRERGHGIPYEVRSLHELEEFLLGDPRPSMDNPPPPQPLSDSP